VEIMETLLKIAGTQPTLKRGVQRLRNPRRRVLGTKPRNLVVGVAAQAAACLDRPRVGKT
jgi:hypothetical protein